jgi:iron complex outermembrane receptor protein
MAAASAASAQSTTEPARPATGPGSDNDVVSNVDDIVVTAQRRSETALRTPLAITAVRGEELTSRGVTSLATLSALAPSLHADSSGQTFMRGIGSTNLNETGDPALAIQLDGIYLARVAALNGVLYDVSRVEVVRGPQGTLYGRNATAGAINIINNRPVIGELSGQVALEAGNYNSLKANGFGNIPISDSLALRVAIQTVSHGAYVKNKNPAGNNAYDQDDKAARVSLLYKPSDDFNIYLAADTLRRGGLAGFTANSNSSAVVDEVVGVPAHPRTFNSPIVTNQDDRYYGAVGEMNWRLGPGTLTFLSGYRTERRDERSRNLQANDTWNAIRYLNRESTFSNELRYGFNAASFQGVVGLYSFNERNSVNLRSGTPAAFFASPGAGAREFDSPYVRARSRAIFGQGTLTVAPGLRITAGGRSTWDRKARTGTINTVNGYTGALISLVGLNYADVKFTNFSWKAGLEYDLAPQVIVYANAAPGYKAGGYFDGDGRVVNNQFKPEHLMSYEAGLKGRLLDNALTVSMSGFLYDYRDFQVSSQVLVGGQPAGATVNAQKARLWGLELEGQLRPTPNDQFGFTLGYLNAKYTRFDLPNGDSFSNAGLPASAPRVPVSFTGTTMANSPRFNGTVNYQHIFDLGGDSKLIPRAEVHFESGNWLEYHHFASSFQKGWTKTDLTLTYQAGSKWSLAAFVRNLEDANVKTYALPSVPATVSPVTVTSIMYAPPRLIGMRASVNF